MQSFEKNLSKYGAVLEKKTRSGREFIPKEEKQDSSSSKSSTIKRSTTPEKPTKLSELNIKENIARQNSKVTVRSVIDLVGQAITPEKKGKTKEKIHVKPDQPVQKISAETSSNPNPPSRDETPTTIQQLSKVLLSRTTNIDNKSKRSFIQSSLRSPISSEKRISKKPSSAKISIPQILTKSNDDEEEFESKKKDYVEKMRQKENNETLQKNRILTTRSSNFHISESNSQKSVKCKDIEEKGVGEIITEEHNKQLQTITTIEPAPSSKLSSLPISEKTKSLDTNINRTDLQSDHEISSKSSSIVIVEEPEIYPKFNTGDYVLSAFKDKHEYGARIIDCLPFQQNAGLAKEGRQKRSARQQMRRSGINYTEPHFKIKYYDQKEAIVKYDKIREWVPDEKFDKKLLSFDSKVAKAAYNSYTSLLKIKQAEEKRLKRIQLEEAVKSQRSENGDRSESSVALKPDSQPLPEVVSEPEPLSQEEVNKRMEVFEFAASSNFSASTVEDEIKKNKKLSSKTSKQKTNKKQKKPIGKSIIESKSSDIINDDNVLAANEPEKLQIKAKKSQTSDSASTVDTTSDSTPLQPRLTRRNL